MGVQLLHQQPATSPVAFSWNMKALILTNPWFLNSNVDIDWKCSRKSNSALQVINLTNYNSLPTETQSVIFKMEHQASQPRYRKLCKVGQGAYGTVYKAEDAATNTVVALKKVKINEEEEGVPVTAVREIAILQSLSHPGIIKLLGIHEETEEQRSKLYMILQYVPQTLSQYIRRNNPLPPYITRIFIFQLIKILEYLVTRKIIHRDLKPSNILVTTDGKLKLCDFGLAKKFEMPLKEMTPGVGTLWYRAPEILLGSRGYWMTAEMWAIGCIMAEMCEGRPLFRQGSEIGQLFEMFSALGTPTIESYPDIIKLKYFTPTFPKFKPQGLDILRIDPVGLQFLYRLLVINPEHRMTIKQALGHEYLQNCY